MTIFYKKNLTKTSKWLRHSLSLMILMFCLVMGLRGQNNALNFDDVNDYVSIPNDASLNFGTATDYTLEAWINYTVSQGNYTGILAKGTGGGWTGYQFVLVNNKIFIETRSNLGNIVGVSGTTVLNDGVWHHVAVVCTRSSNNMKIYVDGVLEANVTNANISQNIDSGSPLYIASERALGGSYFGGNIDEVRIWNTARTCDQINAVKNRELVGTESNLVVYYNFNQGVASGTNTGLISLPDLATTIGGANNGTLTNFALTGATSNWVDGTGNGVSGTTPQVPAEINLNVGASGSTRNVGGYANNSNTNFTYTIQNLGGMSLSLTGTPKISITAGSGFTIQTQPSVATIAGGSSTTFVIRFSPTVLGTSYSTTFSLSNSDCDESTYTFTLTGKSISATPSGLRGNMLNCSTTNQYVSVPAISLATNYTLESWFVSPLPSNTYCTLFRGNSHHPVLTENNILGVFDNAGGGFKTTGFNMTSLSAGWHHLAAVGTGSTTTFYIDGILVGTSAFKSNNDIVAIGNYQGSGQNFGTIDETRIWNTTRTQAQIRENMHLTLSGSETGLLAYYQFNESSGNAIDAISGNNGTLNNSPTRTTSTVSVAKGISTRQTVSSTGSTSFGNLIVNFATMSAPAANDEFVGYQLYDTPLNNVSGVTSTTSNYWLVRQFGTQTFTYDQMTYVIPSSNTISAADEAAPTNFKLYKRTHNSAGAWGTAIGTGLSASNASHTIIYTISPAQNSFSELIPTSTGSSSLPITLIKFEGKRINLEQVLLTWQTANELNNQGFEIEQSIDNQSFSKIGFVDGANNSNSIRNYQFTIINSESAYYRLKQIDTDGKYNYSASVYVKGNEINNFILYPNPAAETLNMELNGKQASSEVINLRVYNAQGNQIWTKTSTLTEMQSLLNTHFKTWKAGLYLIQIQTKDGVKQEKLIKY